MGGVQHLVGWGSEATQGLEMGKPREVWEMLDLFKFSNINGTKPSRAAALLHCYTQSGIPGLHPTVYM